MILRFVHGLCKADVGPDGRADEIQKPERYIDLGRVILLGYFGTNLV